MPLDASESTNEKFNIEQHSTNKLAQQNNSDETIELHIVHNQTQTLITCDGHKVRSLYSKRQIIVVTTCWYLCIFKTNQKQILFSMLNIECIKKKDNVHATQMIIKC